MQECINLVPADGRPFDVDSIRSHLRKHPHVVDDARSIEQLRIVYGEDAQAHLRRQIESGAQPLVGSVVVVRDDLVHFTTTYSSKQELPIVRDLAQWVVDSYTCRIFGLVEGDEWTEQCAGSVDPMFEPELPRRS